MIAESVPVFSRIWMKTTLKQGPYSGLTHI